MSVTFLQVVAGILRPDSESNIRPIFNWGHWFMGKSAHILSGIVLGNSGCSFKLQMLCYTYKCYIKQTKYTSKDEQIDE
jgi:hypothetical protein